MEFLYAWLSLLKLSKFDTHHIPPKIHPMTRRLFHFRALQCIAFLSLLTAGYATAAKAPSVGAKRAIVVDYDSGRILYQKNAHQKCAVASTQKLLTALCVLDAGSLRDKVTIAKTDTYVEPTKIYVRPGETYTRYDLVKALMVKSGNDVARALARDVSGSQVSFAHYMNQKAAQMGMRSSHFRNPHGLTEKGQYSTAYDVAILARNAYSRKTIRDMVSNKGYYFQHPNGQRKFLKNTNRLVRGLPFCNGMKTGTTNASGRCLVSSGTYKGRTAIVVVLGATSSTVWTDSERLLRWALGV
jgi:D-alanyl-D-alanine carboxypeptidase (penicillin-binding protein 5/6)